MKGERLPFRCINGTVQFSEGFCDRGSSFCCPHPNDYLDLIVKTAALERERVGRVIVEIVIIGDYMFSLPL